jgi:hypothetical protein
MIDRRWLRPLLIASIVAACSAPAPLPQPTGGEGSPGPTGGAGTPGPTTAGVIPTDSTDTSLPVAAIPQSSACDLLFKADVATVVGTTVEQAQEMSANSDETGWLSDCVYWRHAFYDQAPLDLTLSSGQASQERFADIATEHGVAPLAGVGDEALIRVSTIWGLDQPLSALFVRAGGAYLGLTLGIVDVTDEGTLVVPGDSAAQQTMLVDLANIAVRRLTGPPEPVAKTCDLLSLADASAITGDPLTAVEDVDEHDVLGPTCHYNDATGKTLLLVSVNDQQVARDRFDTCQQTGQVVVGAGDASFLGRQDCAALIVDYLPLEPVLYARSADTILTVGQASPHNNNDSPDPVTAVARKVLGELGLNVGTTPAPTAFDIRAHMCDVVTAAQVSSILAIPITSADTGAATCQYHSGDGSFTPLWVGVALGPDAVTSFQNVGSLPKSEQVPLTGLGDQAFSETFPADSGYPSTVRVYILSGQAVVSLFMDASGMAPDGVSFVAPGTAEQQLAMLREIAEIILPQLQAPPG